MPQLVTFGDGINGNASLSGTHSPVQTGCSTNTTTVLNVTSTTGFTAGDYVYIEQIMGTGATLRDIIQVSSVGSGVLNLAKAMTNTYSSTGSNKAQVILIPRYTGLTIGSTFTVNAFDGTVGGVFVAMVNGRTYLNADFSATGKGFRGGSGGLAATGTPDTGDTAESSSGPSIAGGTGVTTSAGIATNGSGGQGAQGRRGPDTAAGGGGGGHGAAGTVGEDSVGPGAVGGGAGGSTSGNSDLFTAMDFGGGGGGGGKANDPGVGGQTPQGDGGDGGGKIILFTKEFVMGGSGSLHAKGSSGDNGGNNEHGAGGGGAGGSILIVCNRGELGTNQISVAGGTGGTTGDSGGNGGSGGGGRILIQACSLTGSVENTYGSLSQSIGGHSFCGSLTYMF